MTTSFTSHSDKQLFAMMGDELHREASFRELYRRYEQRTWAYCMVCVHSESRAKDLIQELFLRVFRAACKGTVVENVGAYIMRILRNLCIDDIRAHATENVDIDDIELPELQSDYYRFELQQMVESAIQLLPLEYREALVLQTYGELSYEEISDELQLPVSTIRNRIARAKTRLRKILEPYFITGDDR